ncbi:MAG TPA: ribose-phosphate pyrophosphokinase [Dehalococcoidales bacterium]|nr:MAG: ribose-phosphate pyrophosphokinase [Chloroflexi bacterium RBG_16_60_22]HJX11947.1 ribose-phosphate pyrophosphokinase [Dehalococcoidales bacterium]
MDELKVFSGSAHPALTQAITEYLGIPPGKCEVIQFSNENTFVRILENVRSRDTFVVQPISSPVNSNLVELLIMIDALKRASAGRITAVIPYYGYGRTDKKDQPRVPITAKLVADLITVAGAGRVLTVDLHAAQIQGFFNIPVDELTALYVLGDYFSEREFNDLVVVAADIGATKRARDLAAKLDAPLAIMEKRRLGNADRTQTLNVIGEVEGMSALIVDDEIDTAGSLVGVVKALIDRGAHDVYACCTHPILSGSAIERIAASPVKEVVVTDTVPVPEKKKIDKIKVLSLAPLLGEAISRIHTGQSVGALFEQQ